MRKHRNRVEPRCLLSALLSNSIVRRVRREIRTNLLKMSLTYMICLLCLLVPLGVVPQSIERERIAELYLVRSGLNTVDYEKIAATVDGIVSFSWELSKCGSAKRDSQAIHANSANSGNLIDFSMAFGYST